MSTPTPHINAQIGDFAPTVLMPGDPLRAKFIAQHFLKSVREVTNVRGMLGFTGQYKGVSVSVMGHGMGIPSASIYATELFRFYEVENIIRIGSCGAIQADIQLQDIVIGMGACTDSGVNRARFMGYDFAAIADYYLLNTAVMAAKNLEAKVRVGNLFSTDLFYTPQPEIFDVLERYNVLGIEMEAAGIYGAAAECGKRALAICTVSDHIRREEALDAEMRQTSFKSMMEMALETVFMIDGE